jgi:tRNA U34 5-methylaminomethyl-2-thiouridine-forming methyltransferase MnmC
MAANYPQIEVVISGDGSPTLQLATGETYHSRHGAIAESRHVFIQAGLAPQLERLAPAPLRVLEIGLGTGLNVLLTAEVAAHFPQARVEMVSLEPYPLPAEVVGQLDYAARLRGQSAQVLALVHGSAWGVPVQIGDHLQFTKHQVALADFDGPARWFDLVYYDAFAPRSQPELWSAATFAHLANWLRPGAKLVTYCAQGQFRRNLRAAGFRVERLPGPPGKTEMTRATLDQDALS